MGKLGNIVLATKMFLNFLGDIFASWEANFVSATMFPDVGKQGNIHRKHNVSATMFPSLPRALDKCGPPKNIVQSNCNPNLLLLQGKDIF